MKQKSFWNITDRILQVVILITALLVLAFSLKSSRMTQPAGIAAWTEGWYYLTESGERVEVSLPATVQLEEDSSGSEEGQTGAAEEQENSASEQTAAEEEQIDSAEEQVVAEEAQVVSAEGLQISSAENGLYLYHDTLLKACAGQTLLVRGCRNEMKILADKEILYDSTDHMYDRTDQIESKMNCMVSLDGGDDERRISLSFAPNGDGIYEIGTVYAGSSEAVFLHCLRQDLLILVILFLMLMLGLLAWVIFFYLKKQDLADPRFADMGNFLMLCGIWCGTDASVIQQIAGNSPTIYYLSYFSFMLLPIPLIRFVRHTVIQDREYPLAGICGLFYLNFLGQTILSFSGIFTLVQMLFVTHLLMLFAVVVIGVELRHAWNLSQQEGQEDRREEIGLIMRAVGVLCGSALLALFLYWLLKFRNYGLLVEIGMLIFVGQILVSLVDAAVNGVGYKAEMQVYERMALEDRLTGMGNHRAFEEQMEEISLHAAEYENVMLIFMDLNRLKVVNDQFGHGAGDEMLIGAAICIDCAFSEYGSCYRIGGDEFCAVIINPTRTRKELFQILDEKISDYNVNAAYRVSIARGASYLRDAQNRVRTVSDWKQDADQKMYENKKWQHKHLEDIQNRG